MFKILYYIMLYYIIIFFIILYCIVIFYYIILYYILFYYIIFYCIILYYIIYLQYIIHIHYIIHNHITCFYFISYIYIYTLYIYICCQVGRISSYPHGVFSPTPWRDRFGSPGAKLPALRRCLRCALGGVAGWLGIGWSKQKCGENVRNV